MKIYNIILFCSLLLFSCGGNEEVAEQAEENEESGLSTNLGEPFEISGQITGALNQPLYLEAQSDKGVIQIAQATIGTEGKFVMKGTIQGMGLYQLRIGVLDGKIIPVTLAPNDKVTLTASFASFELLPVWSGAKWAEPLTNYMRIYNEFANGQRELGANKSLTEKEKLARFFEIKKPLDNYAKTQMDKDPSNPANLVLVTSLMPAMGFENWNPEFLSTLKKCGKAYKSAYKDSPIAEMMMNQANEIESAYKDYKLTASGNKMAPEISLKNPEGKTISLSSLRGKVVLIDFWASWCGPCRRENPNVVKLYHKYKDKGFTVFSVSLDKDAAAWQRAIKADGLIWPNHVSDLKEWQTPLTKLYGFNSIPYTVLVGKDGKIITTNLRGEDLEAKLKEVL